MRGGMRGKNQHCVRSLLVGQQLPDVSCGNGQEKPISLVQSLTTHEAAIRAAGPSSMGPAALSIAGAVLLRRRVGCALMDGLDLGQDFWIEGQVQRAEVFA